MNSIVFVWALIAFITIFLAYISLCGYVIVMKNSVKLFELNWGHRILYGGGKHTSEPSFIRWWIYSIVSMVVGFIPIIFGLIILLIIFG